MKLIDLLGGKPYFYIMHLSYEGDNKENLWNYAKNKKCIGLSLPGIVTERWGIKRDLWIRKLSNQRPGWIRQFTLFCDEMDKDDRVLILDGWSSILGLAKIKQQKYDYNLGLSQDGKFFDHYREVEWLKANEYGKKQALSKPLRFNNTLSRVVEGSNRWLELVDIEIK